MSDTFQRIAWNCWVKSFDESSLESDYELLESIGINAIVVQCCHPDWRVPGYDYTKYDRIFNIANNYGLKVYWFLQIEGLDWKNPGLDNKTFIEHYKTFAACGGWLWGDQLSYCSHPDRIYCHNPDYTPPPHAQLEQLYNKIKTQDPDHPCFAVWGYNLEDCYSESYSGGHGCDTYDVGCQYIRPYALSEDPDAFLRKWIQKGMHMPSAENPLDGFLDCGKGMIPVIQAYTHYPSVDEENQDWKQNIIDQYNIWNEDYPFSTEVMKGIGFYCYPGFSGRDDVAKAWRQKDIREGIKAVSILTGWTE